MDSGAIRRAVSLSLLIGLTLVVAHDQIARLLARLIPQRGEVKSGGTFFPAFADASPSIVARTGLALIALPALVAAWERWVAPNNISQRLAWAATGGVVLGTGVWFRFLATPHNAFPSNARIHWVDYLTSKSDNFFYAAGRIPHFVFYDNPPIWQGLNAALLVAVSIAVARRLGHSLIASSLLAVFVATAGNVLRFANSAEDVLINLTLAMFAILASLSPRRWLFGMSLGVLMLGRPQFAIVVPCAILAEVLPAARRRQRPPRKALEGGAIVAASAIATTVAAQIVFTMVGRRYFLTNGNFVDVAELATVEAREIDGFIIYPLSGSYVYHALWVLPLALLACAVWSVAVAPRLPERSESSVYFCGLSVAALLTLHELRPLLYFNVRYVTYFFPFLVAMGWAASVALSRPTQEQRVLRTPWWSSTVAVAVIIGSWTIPGDAIDLRNRVAERPEVELLEVRSELRQATEGRTVYLDFPSVNSRNYVAYALRRPVEEVILVSDEPVQPGGVLLSPNDIGGLVADPDLSTERIYVYLDPVVAGDR